MPTARCFLPRPARYSSSEDRSSTWVTAVSITSITCQSQGSTEKERPEQPPCSQPESRIWGSQPEVREVTRTLSFRGSEMEDNPCLHIVGAQRVVAKLLILHRERSPSLLRVSKPYTCLQDSAICLRSCESREPLRKPQPGFHRPMAPSISVPTPPTGARGTRPRANTAETIWLSIGWGRRLTLVPQTGPSSVQRERSRCP